MGFFDKFKTLEQGVVNNARRVEDVVLGEIATIEVNARAVFEKARAEAIAANSEVNRLKSQLQAALVRARDLHQVAADAATQAVAAAEADAARLKQAASAHLADFKTQASQVVAAPAEDSAEDRSPSSSN